MNRVEQYPEIKEIADVVCSDQVTPEQLAHLESLLKGDFAAQQFYYDYINMHMHLKVPTDTSTEIIYRRLTEEVVVRSKDKVSSQQLEQIERKHLWSKSALFSAFLIIALLLVALIWQLNSQTHFPIVGHLSQGQLSLYTQQGEIDGSALSAGDYHTEQGAIVKLVNGDELHLAPQSVVKLFNNKEIKLKKGKLTIQPLTPDNTIVHTRDFIAHSHGGTLGLDLTHDNVRLSSGKNSKLTPIRWRPIHYWSFDGHGDRVTDSAGTAHGVASSDIARVKGFVGNGALKMDNTRNSHIALGSGGGKAPGSGSFSVNDGLTIEALYHFNHSNKFEKVDEIFRQEGIGNQLRMLLSFEYVGEDKLSQPESRAQNRLVFGLFILGYGYDELELIIDGQAGRPSMAEINDGGFHHIVASYDVKLGLKTLYIDGKQVASYQHLPGSKIVSGGSGNAIIGNKLISSMQEKDVRSSVVDEVAFYNFALPEYTVKHHLMNIKQGMNYFGLDPKEQVLPQRPKMLLPKNRTFELDSLTGLPTKVVNFNSE